MIGSDVHLTRSSNNSLTVIIVFSTVLCDPTLTVRTRRFPDLDLRRLGIADLYKSQKDAVWMLKTKVAASATTRWERGKTLIMCTAAYEMKRLGLANKPMIIGLKANVFDIADNF